MVGMKQEHPQTQTIEAPSEPLTRFAKSAAFWTAVNPVLNGVFGTLEKNGGFTKNFMRSVTTSAGWVGNITWGLTMGLVSVALDAIFKPNQHIVVIHHLPHPTKTAEDGPCEQAGPKPAFAEKEAQRREIPESQQATR